MVEEMEAYRKIIRENISYECLMDSRYRQQEEVDELDELMVELWSCRITALFALAEWTSLW